MKERYPETRESKKKEKGEKSPMRQQARHKRETRGFLAPFTAQWFHSQITFFFFFYPAHSLLLLFFFFLCSPYTPFFHFYFFFSFLFSISQFYFYNPPGSPAVSTTRFSDLQNIILRILIITARLYNYCIVIQTRSKKNPYQSLNARR